jgi:hypothetical protein
MCLHTKKYIYTQFADLLIGKKDGEVREEELGWEQLIISNTCNSMYHWSRKMVRSGRRKSS